MFVHTYRTMFFSSDTRAVLFKGCMNSVLLVTKASLGEYKLTLFSCELTEFIGYLVKHWAALL